MWSERRPLPDTTEYALPKEHQTGYRRENPPPGGSMEHNVYTGISDVGYFSRVCWPRLRAFFPHPLTVIELRWVAADRGRARVSAPGKPESRDLGFRAGFPDGAFWRSRTGSLSVCETAETARALPELGRLSLDDAARRDAALELLKPRLFARPTRAGRGRCAPAASRRRASAFRNTGPAGHEQSAHRAHPAFPDGRRPAIGPQESSPASATMAFRKKTSGRALRPVRPQGQPGTDPRSAWGHGRMGQQRRISALRRTHRHHGAFSCPPSPVLSPALPAIFLLIFPAVFRERTATGYSRAFGREQHIAHSPRTCRTRLSHSARWAVHPAAGGFLLQHGYSGSSGGACPTELVCPPPGRGAACYTVTPYSGPAAALVPCTSTRTAAGRPPPLRRRFAAEDEFIPRWSFITRRAISGGHCGHGTGRGPPSGHESAAFFARRLSGLPGGEVLSRRTPRRRSSTPGRAFRVRLSGLCRPLPLAGALRGAGRGASATPCCAAN